MRRFVASLPGKAVCHLVVTALALPSFTLLAATRAEAQIQTLPVWAVVDFVNKSGKGGEEIAKMAADAVANELSKLNRYDVLPREQVARAVETLNLQTPVTEQVSLLRLGQELRASELVTGEVLNFQIRPANGGKQADVVERIFIRNVNSGIPVNGAAVSASSSVRPADVSDEAILAEAFTNAAVKAVNEIVSRSLPKATILNTWEQTAIINLGSRSGVKIGQNMIILRGSDQVGTAVVSDVSYDDATVRILTYERGIRPGDKAQIVFNAPEIDYTMSTSGPITSTQRRTGRRSSDILQPLLGIAFLALLFGGGRSQKNNVVNRVVSEAVNSDFGTGAGVEVSWSTDMFVRGNEQKVAWNIYRSDIPNTPVLVVDGGRNSAIDDTATRDVNWQTAPRSTFGCQEAPSAGGSSLGTPGVTPGRPYMYEVELLYRVAGEDLPSPRPGAFCYFLSERRAARGLATPLNRPELVSPAPDTTINGPIAFTFNSVVENTPFVAEYVVQFSTSSQFTRSSTTTLPPVRSNSTSTVSSGVISSLPTLIQRWKDQGLSEVWWRVGARNVADVPGPEPDATGLRYIFSVPQRVKLPTTPPPPPGGGGGTPP